MRLIDAHDLMERLYDANPKGRVELAELIETEPTVDAAEVVRCKDCKWGVDYYHEGDCYCLHPKWGLTYFDGSWKFYCADGERREYENT